MFETNDKSLNLLRKIVNVAIFVAMCVCVIIGIVLIAMSFSMVEYSGYMGKYLSINPIALVSGVCTLLLGPVVCQIVWLLTDVYFNTLFDIKLIRNAQCASELNLQKLPAPLFRKSVKESEINSLDVYKKLKDYRILVEENVITEDEFTQIKSNLMANSRESATDSTISKAKELKKLADQKIITEEEFASEKSKILKK